MNRATYQRIGDLLACGVVVGAVVGVLALLVIGTM